MGEGPTARVARATSEDLELLVFVEGVVAVHPLPRNAEIVVGRSQDAQIRIDHESVSREHARIRLGADPEIEDLGSVNGTRLRGATLEPHKAVPLALDAAIDVGQCMLLLRPRRGTTAKAKAATDPMAEVERLIAIVASSDLPVLVVGETGVGKEVVAEKLHASSARANKPLLKLNCAALTETLLESELFGHERGAFTGAVSSKPGLVETADGATLFLDEVGELPLVTQAKLLRAVESGEVMRLGSVKPNHVDVRFIAATNRDLQAMVAEGSFRADLYFRLDGMTIRIPPLRERRGEIVTLARRFIALECAKAQLPPCDIDADAIDRLLAHAWPGNVRELKKVIARAVLLSRPGTILPAHLMGLEEVPVAASELGTSRADAERRAIERALEKAHGNQTRAAEILGISRRTLVDRLERYGFPRPRK